MVQVQRGDSAEQLQLPHNALSPEHTRTLIHSRALSEQVRPSPVQDSPDVPEADLFVEVAAHDALLRAHDVIAA